MQKLSAITHKIQVLGLWESLARYNIAVCPRGTVFPYFALVICEAEKHRLVLLEGWQTLQYVAIFRNDPQAGFCSAFDEMPAFHIIFDSMGEARCYRQDVGYLPIDLPKEAEPLVARMLWEVYGVMLRLESEPKLPMRYFDQHALFSRVEQADGTWIDAPLAITEPPQVPERIMFPNDLLKRVKDLPFDKDLRLNLTFERAQRVTQDARPRFIYELRAVNTTTKEPLFGRDFHIIPGGTLRGMWESLPSCLLDLLLAFGRAPGEVRMVSPRLFRLMRPICLHLPLRLSVHDQFEESK